MRSSAYIPSSMFDATAGNPLSRDQLLYERFRMNEHNLRHVRSEDRATSVYHAAEAIASAGRPEDITHITLAAVINHDWDSPRGQATALYKYLSNIMVNEVLSRYQEWGIKVPAIQCLREVVCGYEGNLYEAKQKWPLIEISHTDFAKNLRVPLTITRKEAYCLGFLWGDGMISHSSGRYAFNLIGGIKDFGFYKKIIIPSLREQFGVHLETEEVRKGWGPKLSVNSQVISSWILNHLGFPHPKRNVHLPKIEWNHYQRLGFLSAIIDSMGSLSHHTKSPTCFGIGINDSDKPFIKDLEALFRIEGFNPLYLANTNGSHRIQLRTQEIRHAYSRGMICHPAWMEDLNVLSE